MRFYISLSDRGLHRAGCGGAKPGGRCACQPSTAAASAGGKQIIDPALRTHTKPLKVDVDLVLVPVTITDPMNRLVTGLDKENFALYEGKDEQEIRIFQRGCPRCHWA